MTPSAYGEGVATPTFPTWPRFAVVDVETTGLDPQRHRIVQVAVVTVAADGTVLDRWSTTVHPGLHRVGARRVHGLTRRELRLAPSFAAIAPEVLRRLDGAVFTAHNAAFDLAFLSAACRRARHPTPHGEWLCTMALSRSLDPQRVDSHRLADVLSRHGLANLRPHDALADAEATAALLPALFAAAGVSDPADLAPHVRHGPPHARRPPAPGLRHWWRAARRSARRVAQRSTSRAAVRPHRSDRPPARHASAPARSAAPQP